MELVIISAEVDVRDRRSAVSDESTFEGEYRQKQILSRLGTILSTLQLRSVLPR